MTCDLSPKFPPLINRVLGCRHADRDVIVGGEAGRHLPQHGPHRRLARCLVQSLQASRKARLRHAVGAGEGRCAGDRSQVPLRELPLAVDRLRGFRIAYPAEGIGCGLHPAIVRTHARACPMLPIPRNIRRSSRTADSSPRCSNAVRIAVASASVTTNIGGACPTDCGWAKQDRLPNRVVTRARICAQRISASNGRETGLCRGCGGPHLTIQGAMIPEPTCPAACASVLAYSSRPQ